METNWRHVLPRPGLSSWTIRSKGVKLYDPSRYRPETDADLCKGCADCEKRCIVDAITVGDNELSDVNAKKCLGCGLCAAGCPNEALTMTEVRKPDFIPA